MHFRLQQQAVHKPIPEPPDECISPAAAGQPDDALCPRYRCGIRLREGLNIGLMSRRRPGIAAETADFAGAQNDKEFPICRQHRVDVPAERHPAHQ